MTRPTPAVVLLVDDERRVTEGLAAILRGPDFEVVTAQSATEALAVLRLRSVDVIVSDEHMPGMKGSELLAAVRSEFPNTARILLTGQATVEAAARAINEGKICQFLEKPCNPVRLRAAIAEGLRSAAVMAAAERLLDVARSETQRLLSRSEPDGSAEAHRRSPPRHQGGLGEFPHELLGSLSVREREIFDLVVEGLRVAQIAGALFLSKHTVRNHIKALFQKLDVHSQADLVAKARGKRRR